MRHVPFLGCAKLRAQPASVAASSMTAARAKSLQNAKIQVKLRSVSRETGSADPSTESCNGTAAKNNDHDWFLTVATSR